MNKRLLSVLFFAVIVAGLASLVLYLQIRTRLDPEPGISTSQVVVATRQLEVGTVIQEGDLKTAAWPGDLPLGSIADPEKAIKRGVVSTIYASEPILENRLAAEGAGGGLAATIPKGMRAVAIKVDQVIGVAGFVVPGMRVDVIIAVNLNEGTGGQGNTTVSKILLQNIEVLSAGQNIQRDAEGKPISVQVVNILVSPEQAERITLASSEARLQLVLRNPLDQDEVNTPGTVMAELVGETRSKPAPVTAPAIPRAAPRVTVAAPPPPPKPTIQVIHGVNVTETTIDNNPGGTR